MLNLYNSFAVSGLIRIAMQCWLVGWLVGGQSQAADWPMWRYDSSRSAASTDQLPSQLAPLWSRAIGARRPAWDDTLNRDLMSYDRLLEPIVKDGRMFVGLNDRDQLVAYSAADGKWLWSYYCDGPVRLPPVAWQNFVYCASDDGFLHCVDAVTGKLHWKFRGGPINATQLSTASSSGQNAVAGHSVTLGRLSLGNQRLISAWPARGGPVLRDGQIYFTASIWPFMGTFIYALDAQTGRTLWVNDETGAQYIRQPHSAPAFAGVAPQGALVATEKALIVPGGRSVPAVFERQTGKMRYFELNAAGKGTGGSFVAANESSWFVHTRERGTREFALDSGLKTAFMPNEPVLSGETIYSAVDADGKRFIRAYHSQTKDVQWETPVDALGDLIQAGQHLVAASSSVDGQSTISLVRLPSAGQTAKIVASQTIAGTVQRLLAADGQVLAVTLEGTIHALGAPRSTGSTSNPVDSLTETESKNKVKRLEVDPDAAHRATSLMAAGEAVGYAILIGAEEEALVRGLANLSPFAELSVFDDQAERVANLRRQLDDAGLYGRVTVHQSTLDDLMLPPYLAHELFVSPKQSLALVDNPASLSRIYESVRPYGGVLCLMTKPDNKSPDNKNPDDASRIVRAVRAAGLQKAKVEMHTWGISVKREGSLPGSGTWTHQYGDVANTIKSNDQLVKLPLGVLWYGGVSHEDVLPRHGHGPPEQVVGGRLFIQGIDSLTARDVYTGRVLWQRKFENLGTDDVYFDDTYKETPLDTAYNQVHIPGANGRGTNYVVTDDRIYILEGATCHVLDNATGKTIVDMQLPQTDPANPNEWGYIGVYENVLIGGVGFAKYRARDAIEDDSKAAKGNKSGFGAKSLDRAASLALIGFDRHTGKQLWHVPARHSFWHNGIVAGNGQIFVLDKNPKPVEDYLKRRGQSDPKTYRLMAFNALSGTLQWEREGDVFGSWLGYSAQRDMLLQAGAAASDRLAAEIGQGMAVYQGATGEVVWRKTDLKYSGPCVLHNDLVITNANSYTESSGAYYLSDGSQKMTKNPLTGQFEPWKITRAYGCNSIVASENLLTFRSGAAGYYDLLTEAGTGNLGGFRSGCTSNLIAADGVLNAPDYTRTCSCSYQNQTSLALVHMPELDTWTISNSAVLSPKMGRIQEVGINLGAPGDRRDASGLMWLEYPAVSGDAPNIALDWQGPGTLFQDHPSLLADADLPWVASSGIEGLKELNIGLVAKPTHTLKSGWPVEHTHDDAEETADGSILLDSSGLDIGQDGEQSQIIGVRFNGLKLARNADIRSAHLQLTAKSIGEADAEFSIVVEASGNASAISDQAHNLSKRSTSPSKVIWKPEAWKKDGESSTAQRSPDLSALIREVTSRADWVPGNSILFLIRGTGSRAAAAFRGNDSGGAKLLIDADEAQTDGADAVEQVAYRVRLHFGLPRASLDQERHFDVDVAGQTMLKDIRLGGSHGPTVVHTIDNVKLRNNLNLKFHAHVGAPVISGIELQRTK